MPEQEKALDPNIAPSKTLILNPNVIDVEGLSESQIAELKFKRANMCMEFERKIADTKLSIEGLSGTLNTLNSSVEKNIQDGSSSTIEHFHEDSLGKTQVIMGTTERAARGKISNSITGESDNMVKIAIIIAIAIVLAALFLGKS